MDSMSIKKKAIIVALPSPSDNIILTGFMGCGKSHFSYYLAKELGFALKDTDSMIEAKANSSIKEIFDNFGESYFRSLEKEISLEIQNKCSHTVFATGGGFPIHCETILEIGTVFYMDIPFEKILERMTQQERDKRPLFQDIEQAKALYDSRLQLYRERSHYQIDATKPIEDMVNFVKSKLNKN